MPIDFFIDWIYEFREDYYERFDEEELVFLAEQEYSRLNSTLQKHHWDCLCLLHR